MHETSVYDVKDYNSKEKFVRSLTCERNKLWFVLYVLVFFPLALSPLLITWLVFAAMLSANFFPQDGNGSLYQLIVYVAAFFLACPFTCKIAIEMILIVVLPGPTAEQEGSTMLTSLGHQDGMIVDSQSVVCVNFYLPKTGKERGRDRTEKKGARSPPD